MRSLDYTRLFVADSKVKVRNNGEQLQPTVIYWGASEEESARIHLREGNENAGKEENNRELFRRKSQQRIYYIGIDRRHTVLFLSGRVNRPVVGHPLIHLDELGHEARYFAFHDRAVSPDHVLVLGLGDIELRNDCQSAGNVLTLRDAMKNKPFIIRI